MELIAVLVNTTNEESGISQDGKQWKRRTALFETIGDSRFKKTVAVSFINQLAEAIMKYAKGNLLKVQLDAESHLYQGKYYTELRAWKVQPAYTIATNDEATQAAAPQNAPEAQAAAPQNQATEMMLDANGNPVTTTQSQP